MADEDLTVRASLDDDLSRPLERVRGKVERVGDEIARTDRKAKRADGGLSRLARTGGRLAKVLGATLVVGAAAGAAALGALAAGTVFVGAKLVGLASDAEETASKFRTVFAGNIKDVDAWVKKTNAAYGITTKDLQDAASTFGVFGKAAGIAGKDLPGFSTSLAQAGLDLSSFYNVDPAEAFLALRSGLAGEAEPLRKFGIFLSDATMKAEAATMGLTGELTEQQKVMVRQRLILKGLGDAEGDLERTKDSLANKTRALKGRLVELGTGIGRALVPMAQKLVGWLEAKLAPIVTRLTDNMPELTAAVGDALGGRGFGGLASVLDRIFGGTGTGGIAGAVNAFGNALARIRDIGRAVLDGWRTGGLQGAVTGFGEATGAGDTFSNAVNGLIRTVQNLATIFRESVLPALEDLGPVATGILAPLTLLDDVTGYLADNSETLTPILEVLIAAWAGYKVVAIAATAQQWLLNTALTANPIGLTVAAVAALATGLVLLYQRSETFRNIVDGIGRGAKAAFGWLLDNWKSLALIVFGGPIGALAVLYQKVTPVRNAFDALADIFQAVGSFTFGALKSALRWIGDRIDTIVGAARGAADAIASIPGAGVLGDVVGAVVPGDTPRPRARGARGRHRAGGNLANTLAVHQAADRMTPGRRLITSSIRSHALGSANSDHPAGKALDLKGSNLNAYARNLRSLGGYAAHHGNGSGRHLHAAIGDTARPMASTRPAPTSTGDTYITVAAGAIVVERPVDTVELELALAGGLRRYTRERRERGA